MKPVHYFSKADLARSRKLKPEQVLRYLEDYRLLRQAQDLRPSRLISIKVPQALLEAFKTKARVKGILYQTQIKKLMQDWVD